MREANFDFLIARLAIKMTRNSTVERAMPGSEMALCPVETHCQTIRPSEKARSADATRTPPQRLSPGEFLYKYRIPIPTRSAIVTPCQDSLISTGAGTKPADVQDWSAHRTKRSSMTPNMTAPMVLRFHIADPFHGVIQLCCLDRAEPVARDRCCRRSDQSGQSALGSILGPRRASRPLRSCL